MIQMTVNALICDDDKACVDEALSYFKRYCEERDIVCFYDCFTDGESALQTEKAYDIAFLDIEIGAVSGLSIARELKERNQSVIIFFITAYEKYIDDAMDLFALRFIHKPLEYLRFYNGLDKAIELINEDIVEFYLRDSNKLQKIKSKDIMYVETYDHKTKLFTVDGVYYSSELIEYWQRKLTHISFYRIHKSFVVNLDYVDEYTREEVKLTNGEIIPISYRNQAAFRKYFFGYLKRRK